jgi:hypothetical protein
MNATQIKHKEYIISLTLLQVVLFFINPFNLPKTIDYLYCRHIIRHKYSLPLACFLNRSEARRFYHLYFGEWVPRKDMLNPDPYNDMDIDMIGYEFEHFGQTF